MTEEDEIKGFELGAVDYIAKPFNETIVKARVKSHLELKRHRDFLEWMIREKNEELSKMEEEYECLFFRKRSKTGCRGAKHGGHAFRGQTRPRSADCR